MQLVDMCIDINRDILECKFNLQHSLGVSLLILIETYWNVNVSDLWIS